MLRTRDGIVLRAPAGAAVLGQTASVFVRPEKLAFGAAHGLHLAFGTGISA